jgi:hypothetical protein
MSKSPSNRTTRKRSRGSRTDASTADLEKKEAEEKVKRLTEKLTHI